MHQKSTEFSVYPVSNNCFSTIMCMNSFAWTVSLIWSSSAPRPAA